MPKRETAPAQAKTTPKKCAYCHSPNCTLHNLEKYPPKKVQCRYCHVTFTTKPTYNGSQQGFCIPGHRKAFQREGRKPIATILKRQEKHMREIARAVAREVFDDGLEKLRAQVGDNRIQFSARVREVAREVFNEEFYRPSIFN